ncbi:Ig-like domain-containing protein [Flavilitoribacter nigricans]|uniref:PKD domain-containing protein n=1 Tax=Flavilitoribacter nigricans (strain ATCC 23147 / DSM 23189 / NBRC 102662 / NCIMB 1420 / SS-2) TaxID=1122177 RepID=A0A2D0NAK8_FLAN2|nr:PKD domain-containing protein [Flavilitoribacter nigricans]PHN05551.1 hypothetical protein CRP01_16295 [Flavilitoribacter nigricans DSM 23189 = NBRC 102662]
MNCKFSQKSLPRRSKWLVLSLLFAISQFAWAEGTRQVAPTPLDSIVMLETNRPDFGNFASYGGPADSRLVVTLANPTEILYIGLSGEYNDAGRQLDLGRSRYRFRIVDSNGNIVHGPFLIDNSTANVNNWTQSQFGNYDVSRTQNGLPIYEFAPGQAGDYYIEFTDVLSDGDNKVNIAFWDFTVTQGGQPIPGRIWSKNWAFRTPPTNMDILPDCEWDRPFSGVLYSYTTDGFVSRIDFSESGFQGLSFNVAFNSTGPGTTGSLEQDRQSIPGFNATAFSAEHRIFLNEPDPLVFPDGDCGGITSATTFSCADGDGFCLDVTVSDPGQVEIVIDFNQNGMFDPESTDVSIVYNFTQDELNACVPWNGLRGDSTMVAFGDTVDLLFTYTRGVQHYAVYDAEFLKNGFCVETVRPICGDAGANRLYWDDRAILEDSGTGQPKDGRGGCECGVDNCRTWTNFNINVDNCADRMDALTTGYGDKNTINTWWFASSSLVTRADIPLLSCQILGDTTLCDGASTELSVEVSGSFDTFTYTWSGPGGFSSTEASTGPLTVEGEYCVTVTNPVGCERVCCQNIVLSEAPTLEAVTTNASCDAAEDGIIMATATGGQGGYQYALNGGDFQDSGIFAGLAAGDYEVSVQDMQGCTDVLPVTIGVESAIDLSYPEVVEVCFGSTGGITFMGDATGLAFSWEPATGIDDPTSPTPVFSPNVTTTYTVTISDLDAPECFIQDEVTVVVSTDINPQVSGNLSGCEPQTTLTASSDVPATFTWLDSNGDVIGNGTTITLPLMGEINYTLQAQDAAGCIQEAPFTLSGGPVNVSLPDTLAACTGEELQLIAVNQDPNDVLTFSWTPADAFAGGTDTATPDYIEVLGTNTVFVDITNQFGCTYRDTVEVAILDADATYDFESELQCDGATVIFNNTSTGAFGFIWDFGDGTTSTEVSPTHVYSEAGTYTVQLTSIYDASCVSTKIEQVTVREPELIAGFSYDLIDCSSASATIMFTDTSFNSMNNTVAWSWTFSDGQTSNEQNPTITFNAAGELTVTLTITSDNGCEESETQTIDIQLVDIDLPAEVAICPGESVVLNPDGNPEYIYQWSPATGLDDPTAASPTASPTETTQYTLTVLNIAGSDTCAVTQQITVMVPDAINLDLGDDIITCGEDAEITFTADVEVTIQWMSTSEGDLGTGTSVTVNPLRRDTIIATATGAGGCTEMDTVIVIDQGVDIMTDPLSPITTCSGQETVITIINQDQLDELTYEWSPAGNIISATDGPSVTVVVEEGTVTFQAIVSNQFECSDTISIDVTAVPFDPTVPDTIFVCAGDPTAINPDFTDGYTYTWSPEAGLDDPNAPNPVFSGDQTTVFNVTITDASQTVACEAIDSVVVIVSPAINLETTGDTTLCVSTALTLGASTDIPATITWYDDADLTNMIGNGTSVDINPPAEDGTYTYTAVATDETTACSDTSTVTVVVNDISDSLPDDNIDVCANTPTPINPGGDPDLTYEWSSEDNLDLTTNGPHNPIFTGTDTMTYTVTVSDPTGECVITKDVVIAVSPPINLMASGDTTLCEVTPVTLMATANAEVTFTWYDNPELSGDPVGEGAEITVTPPSDTTMYTVVASDAVGCTEQDTVTVIVSPILAEITPPQVFCEPTEGITIMVTNLDPTVELTYQWSPTDATDPDEGPIVSVNPELAEEYTVTVTNAEGCELVLSTTVQVEDLSQLEISAEPQDICLGESTTITVSGCEDCTYTWTGPGEITPDDGPVVTVTPDEDGLVTYTVTVEKDGCMETLSIPIMVTELICTAEYFFLPNAFTPNGDNINDILRVRSNFLEKITGFELQIYNRWGDLVFKTENPMDGWMGRYL